MRDEKKKRVILIMQARMGSTRLPGKSLMPLAGKPFVERVIERVKRCAAVDEIVLATTKKTGDDAIEALGRACGVSVFRGSENDLVDRYYRCAMCHGADVVVRVPADNATPESAVIDRTIEFHLKSNNDFSSTYPDFFENGYPDGIGCEVFNFDALERVWKTSTSPRNREHPHTNFYENRNLYRVGTFECPAKYRRPDIILDVNTWEQYCFIRRMYEDIYPSKPNFDIMDIIEWYDKVGKYVNKDAIDAVVQ